MSVETCNTLRCRHRNYTDFLARCDVCYSLCFPCLLAHLNQHAGVTHAICENWLDTAAISLSLRSGFQHYHWNFSSADIAASFFSHYEGRIDSIRIKNPSSESTALCTVLIQFDHIKRISVTGLELQSDAAHRAFAAWIRCQTRLSRLSLSYSRFTGRAFSYLSTGLSSNFLHELTLSSVSLPDGCMGELVRRVLDKGSLQKLSLRGMKLSESDLAAIGRVEEQQSLKVLKLTELSILGGNHLPEFLEKLKGLETLEMVDRAGKTLQSVGWSLARCPRLRKLALFSHHPYRLLFLPFILPSLPHLRLLTLHESTLQVEFSPAFLDSLTSLLLSFPRNINGEV